MENAGHENQKRLSAESHSWLNIVIHIDQIKEAFYYIIRLL